MKINEVEQAIGMAKKNIRFYEQEGLLTPSRTPGNGYRDYSAADIDTLRQIKLLRKLGISIEDIKKLQENSLSLENCLKQHLITLEQERKNLEATTKFCRRLLSRDVTFNSMPAEQLLADMENMEEGGTRFMTARTQDNKPFPYKRVIPAVIAAALFVVILAFWTGRNSASSDQKSPNAVLYSFYGTYDNSFFLNSTGDVYKPENRVIPFNFKWNHSGDSSLVAYWLLEEDPAYPGAYLHNLYYITEELEPVHVAENANAHMVSYDGSYIAYFKHPESRSPSALYLYQVSSGQTTKIDDWVTGDHFCLSPDGEMIAYRKNGSSLYVGGINREPIEVSHNPPETLGALPLAVSDDGTYLYYLLDNSLYCYNANEKEPPKLIVDLEAVSDPHPLFFYQFFFNKDISEMLFVVNFETYYYTPGLDAPIMIVRDRIEHIPDNQPEIYSCSTYAEIAGVDSLKGCVIGSNDSSLYWLNEDGTNAVTIASDSRGYMLSEDGNSILYLEGGILYRIDAFGEEMKPTVVSEEPNIDYFTASSDLSKIYIAKGHDLYYVKSLNELVLLSHDLKHIRFHNVIPPYNNSLAYDNTSGKIYFLENSTLYQADTTEDSKTIVAENVSRLTLLPGYVSYISNEDAESVLYYLYNGEATEIYTE